MNTKILLAASLIAVFTIGMSASSVAFAQYMGNVGSEGQTGSYTLEEAPQQLKQILLLVQELHILMPVV
jgi:hypothetical protein